MEKNKKNKMQFRYCDFQEFLMSIGVRWQGKILKNTHPDIGWPVVTRCEMGNIMYNEEEIKIIDVYDNEFRFRVNFDTLELYQYDDRLGLKLSAKEDLTDYFDNFVKFKFPKAYYENLLNNCFCAMDEIDENIKLKQKEINSLYAEIDNLKKLKVEIENNTAEYSKELDKVTEKSNKMDGSTAQKVISENKSKETGKQDKIVFVDYKDDTKER